jgi:cyclohexanone monooxygenase
VDNGFKCEPSQTPGDIEIPTLREKYRYEAEKRRRSDHNRQFIATTGEFADFYETDPHTPVRPREPISEDTEVVVLGGGFAGLLAGARLKQAGLSKVRIIDMGGDFGGTWYWNRYPGAQCDVESYTYLPLLEELQYIPKEKYSYGPEIFEHCRRIGKHFGLYEDALFSTIVRSICWDEAIKRWRVKTNRGDEIRTRFVVMGPGPMNKAKLPGVGGVQTFKGHSFHTARWDYSYTGGDTFGGLFKLSDKRVAIIGTGATGIQCVPFVGQYAKHLYVFQRTPSPVDARGNRPTDPEWAKNLKPGWQAARQRSFHIGAAERFAPDDVDVICDGWSEINRNLHAKLAAMGHPRLTSEQWRELREGEDYRVMERLRRRVDGIVRDERAAGLLKPWYRWGCKRPCFSDNYLPTFNRPNVTLVDVSTSKGVEHIDETGIVANGTHYEVDCIIYASGFDVTDDLKRRYAIDPFEGCGGLSLYQHWQEGFRTLHGMTTHGFPNFFYIGYSQGGVSGSLTLGYDTQATHIAYIIQQTIARGASTVEVSKEAQDEWVKTVREKLNFDAKFFAECTPSYFNYEGKAITRYTVHGEPYGGGYYAFDALLRDWRNKGDLQGMIFDFIDRSP